MTQPDPPIVLDLDPSGYIAGMNQSSQATDQFSGSLRSSTAALAAVPLLMRQASAHLPVAGMMAFAGVAARTQQQLSPLRATTKVLGSDFEVMDKGMQRLARSYPIGNSGARQMVTELTKLGVATKGQERNVTDLAKVYVKLGGATGEGPAQLAAGMTQLARVTNTGLNVKRVENLADSLTTVSAKSGASATGILEFSKLIAPLATASGVGTTKIMGVSAAFSKLGEDGVLGANAFNKMMGDLNKSVRDGSPLLANYASVVGKTQAQFTALAKADPTEAITQVTEAIAKAGAAGPRLLEQLGLEGPRTARVLQQLSSSGGLRQSIADSVGAYGSGSTQKGSQEAYKGAIDQAEKFGTALEQVADSLGGPFLNMLTRVTKYSSFGLEGVRRVTSSSPVQDLLKTVATIGVPALLGLKFLGGGVRAAFAGQIATSGPVRGFMGGVATGLESTTGRAAADTFAARRLGGQAYLDAAARGEYGVGRMIPVNQAFERGGARLGAFLGGGNTPGGPGIFTQIRGAGVAATAAVLRMNAEASRLAATPHQLREFHGTPQGAAFRTWQQNQLYDTYLRDQGSLTRGQYARNMFSNARALSAEVGNQGFRANAMTLGRGFGEMATNTIGAGITAAGSVGGKLLTGLGGPVGIGLTAGMVGLQVKGMADAATEKNNAQAANATGFVDDYRIAMGKATEAVNTFAGAMAEATKKTGTGNLSLDQVQSIAAQGGVKSRVRNYSGMSPGQVANQVNLARQGGGVGPEELQRIESDLFNSGFSMNQVRQFRDQLGNGAGDLSSGSDFMTGQVARQQAQARGGWGPRRAFGGIWNQAVAGSGQLTHALHLPGGNSNGDRLTIDTLTGRQREGAAQLVEGINERFGKRASSFNAGFARQEQFKDIDAAVSAALDVGNRDYAERLEKDFTQSIGMKARAVQSTAVDRAGGFTAALAATNKDFRTGLYAEAQKGGSANRYEGFVSERLTSERNPLAQFFDQRGTTPAQQAVQAMVGPSGRPEDPRTQLAATESVIASARHSGMSLEQLAIASGRAANSLGDVNDANSALVRMIRDTVALRLTDQRSQMSSSEAAKSRIRQAVDTATQAPLSVAGMQERQTQQQAVQQEKDDTISRAQARVAAQREMQVQEARQHADFVRQGVYMEQDYATARQRTVEQYEISVFRTERQYNIARSRSIEDYNRQRLYAQQDFNKTMRRAAEDGAKAMYSPYQRIAVQATWDAKNMLGNLAEQNQAIRSQLENLSTLRHAGGTSSLIKLLGLDDPSNAQQLASLVGDVQNDPRVLQALNSQASTRYKLGGQLVNDKDNTPITRQREDYATGMKRQGDVFAQSLSRAANDQRRTLSDMAKDEGRTLLHMSEDRDRSVARFVQGNATALGRMHADIARGDTEITRDLGKLSRDLQGVLNHQTLAFKDDVNSTLQGTIDIIDAFKKNGKYQKALEGLAQAGVSVQLKTFDPTAAFAGTPNTGNAPVDPLTGKPVPRKHAVGGILTRPTAIGPNDVGGEAGYEAMIPLNSRGVDVIAEAMRRAIGSDDIRAIMASQSGGHATFTGSFTTNMDYSQSFEHVTVVSQDPDEMGRKMRDKQRNANLTRAPQVRR